MPRPHDRMQAKDLPQTPHASRGTTQEIWAGTVYAATIAGASRHRAVRPHRHPPARVSGRSRCRPASGAALRHATRRCVMRKLKLRLDEIQVASFHADAAAFLEGTILGAQTEPASVPNPCTGGSC